MILAGNVFAKNASRATGTEGFGLREDECREEEKEDPCGDAHGCGKDDGNNAGMSVASIEGIGGRASGIREQTLSLRSCV